MAASISNKLGKIRSHAKEGHKIGFSDDFCYSWSQCDRILRQLDNLPLIHQFNHDYLTSELYRGLCLDNDLIFFSFFIPY